MRGWGLRTKSHEQRQLTVSILEDDAYVMHDGRGVRIVKYQEKGSHLGVKETTLGNSVCVCVCVCKIDYLLPAQASGLPRNVLHSP